MIRILKNPNNKIFEMMYDGKIYIFLPGERKPVDEGMAILATEEKNTPLIDVTNGEPEPELASMSLQKLLKMAKEKGLKVRFGMSKKEVIALLLNG